MTAEEREARAAKAIELRLAGHSRSQIARALGFKTGGNTLSRWLKGIPAPEWTKRPNAKDDFREKAVAMRLEGRSYREIREVVGVSKSTLSMWLRDVPLTEEHRLALEQRGLDAVQKRADTRKALRVATQRRIKGQAQSQVQALAESELFVAGLVAYWAEGAKDKPWNRREQVAFMNSDPALILIFLRWLELLGVRRERLRFRLSIHESADVEGATRFWSRVVGVREDAFHRATLKRHNPKTVRKNTGDGYRGCLVVSVRRSTNLYRQIEGWFNGLAQSAAQGVLALEPTNLAM